MAVKQEINWKQVAIVIFLSVLFAILMDAFLDFSPDAHLIWSLKAEVNVSYQDLAATLLSAVSVLITILGVIIAIITFVGYKQIKVAAVKKAEAHIKKSIQHPNGTLHKLLKKEAVESLEKISADLSQGMFVPMDWGDEDSEYGDER